MKKEKKSNKELLTLGWLLAFVAEHLGRTAERDRLHADRLPAGAGDAAPDSLALDALPRIMHRGSAVR
jgi:hypothetical protein